MRDLARFYKLFGERTVFLPVAAKTKAPWMDNWQEVTFEQTQQAGYQGILSESPNLGVLLGPPSNNLVSIDFDDDCFYAEFLALNPWAALCLQTKGARGRNLWLRMSGDYPQKCVRLGSKGGKQIGEWRGGNCQTIVDGIHPSGIQYIIINERPIG